MAERAREAWITGIGIVSALGEGADAHWDGLNEGRVTADTVSFAPYIVHPLAPIEFDKQIPRKDLRQMEPWQRMGTYAAGLALENAGIKGDTDILSRIDMVVATGTGERDLNAENVVLAGLPGAANQGAFLNERLMNDLRPRLFLAQLPNLLAGYISILHGVTGSSRTFMGEEQAGVDAARIALARIAAGQSDIALVGGAHNGERKDLLLVYEFGGFNLKGAPAPVWQRNGAPGFALGSLAAFFVLEAREHAEGRGARPLVRLSAVLSERTRRETGAVEGALERMWEHLQAMLLPGEHAIVSGASGAEPATAEEREFLATQQIPVRATATSLGHAMEPQFLMNIALAAIAVDRGALFATRDPSGVETEFDGELRQVVVTSVGHWRGEGMALVEAAN